MSKELWEKYRTVDMKKMFLLILTLISFSAPVYATEPTYVEVPVYIDPNDATVFYDDKSSQKSVRVEGTSLVYHQHYAVGVCKKGEEVCSFLPTVPSYGDPEYRRVKEKQAELKRDLENMIRELKEWNENNPENKKLLKYHQGELSAIFEFEIGTGEVARMTQEIQKLRDRIAELEKLCE